MKPHITEVTELPSDPLGGATGEKRRFRVEFLGKTGNADFPYTVANEVVATHLGIALGLNLPSVLTHRIGGTTCVLIQMVGRDPQMQQPPPATSRVLAEYVKNHPDEVHGAIVFDLFVANNDRALGPERRNLLLDSDGRLLLYDQGNACFYRPRPGAGIRAGIPRLDAVEAELPALFDMDHKRNHDREFLTDWSLVERWCQRIASLPDFLIEGALGRVPADDSPPSPAERSSLRDFLIKRKGYLFDHILRWQSHFPGLSPRGG
ncbi:MAG TPA: hypothetical protein VKA46_16250 [Gemmataceae bacterium]|nr:hypothetical protein [Gemmataceae bacterium]